MSVTRRAKKGRYIRTVRSIYRLFGCFLASRFVKSNRWTALLFMPIIPSRLPVNVNSLETSEAKIVCRSIKNLFNFEPPVTAHEIHAASLQFVRKVTGFNQPAKINEPAFFAAVARITQISSDLLHSLETNLPPKSRTEEAARARARAARRSDE
jgi:hypothetical protein